MLCVSVGGSPLKVQGPISLLISGLWWPKNFLSYRRFPCMAVRKFALAVTFHTGQGTGGACPPRSVPSVPFLRQEVPTSQPQISPCCVPACLAINFSLRHPSIHPSIHHQLRIFILLVHPVPFLGSHSLFNSNVASSTWLAAPLNKRASSPSLAASHPCRRSVFGVCGSASDW